MTTACELIDHAQFGHCAVAARDISIGEIVIDEAPLLLIDYNSLPDPATPDAAAPQTYKRKRAYMTMSRPAKVSFAIAQAPADVRQKIILHFHLPSSTKSVKKTIAYKAADRGASELRKRTSVFPEIDAFSSTDLVGFSLISSANAHSFDEDSIALLSTGCKVTHTCLNPNVAVSTRSRHHSTEAKDEPQTAKHIALRDIKKGELLLGSYAKMTTWTQLERKRYLMHNKMFTCLCSHCTGPDMSRGAKCTRCADETKEQEDDGVPASTMYRQHVTGGKDQVWKCHNCQFEASEDQVLRSWTANGASIELDIRQRMSELEDNNDKLSAKEMLQSSFELYTYCRETFTWRHALTASAALVLLDACAKSIDASETPSDAEIRRVLTLVGALPGLLEAWFEHIGVKTTDELTTIYLLLSEQLMTLSSLHHEIIPESMDLVQSLLLKVRPVIEQRREWEIGHVMEEYYDELLTTLNELVNGVGTGEGDHVEQEELVDPA